MTESKAALMRLSDTIYEISSEAAIFECKNGTM